MGLKLAVLAAALLAATPVSRGAALLQTRQLADGSFGPAVPVYSLNTPSDDFRPNVRKNGLEVVFDSNRTGTLGGQDIWSSTRESVEDDWSTPIDLVTVNTPFAETRASLSWDGLTLTFGSNRPGTEGMAA